MVSVGLLGIVALGTVSAIEMGMKGQVAVEQQSAVTTLQNSIYTALENSGICSYNFGAAGPSQKNVNTMTGTAKLSVPAGIKDASGAELYAIYDAGTGGPVYEGGNLRITSFTFQNFRYLSGTEGQVDLAVGVEKNKESIGGNSFRLRVLKIKVNLAGPYDATLATPNLISSCIAFGGNADQIWSKNPNTSIFYSGANVGIDTSDPKARFQIADKFTINPPTDPTFDSVNLAYNAFWNPSGGGWRTLSAGYSTAISMNNTRPDALNGSIYFYTGPNLPAGSGMDISTFNPKLIISNQGHIGAGTTGPFTARMELHSPDTLTTLLVRNTGGGVGTQPALDVATDAISSGRTIAQFRNGAGTRMVVKDSGHVGIGTTAPLGLLHVAATAHTIGYGAITGLFSGATTAGFASQGVIGYNTSSGPGVIGVSGMTGNGAGGPLGTGIGVQGNGGIGVQGDGEGGTGIGGRFNGATGIVTNSCTGCSVIAEMVPVTGTPVNGDVMCTNRKTGKTETCAEDKSRYIKGIAQKMAEIVLRMGCSETLNKAKGKNSLSLGVMDTEGWKNKKECKGWYPIALSGLSEESNVVCKTPKGVSLGYGDTLVTSNVPGRMRPLDEDEHVLPYQIAGKADTICADGKETDSIQVWVQ